MKTENIKQSSIQTQKEDFFKVQNLRQDFDEFNIDVSFECSRNTITSIIGPSGSGKSTILRLIAGINPPQMEQKIFLDNEDITNLPPAKRHIGMVFQNHTLFDHYNVEDNVAYGLISCGMNKKEARQQARQFLKKFNLEGFEKRYPENLSGGEAQRVCLARTLIIKPKLVLFDEPLSALDAPLRKKLASLIVQLHNDFGFTAIMVTHDINEAKTYSDRIILLKKGQITWQGKPDDFDEKMLEE